MTKKNRLDKLERHLNPDGKRQLVVFPDHAKGYYHDVNGKMYADADLLAQPEDVHVVIWDALMPKDAEGLTPE